MSKEKITIAVSTQFSSRKPNYYIQKVINSTQFNPGDEIEKNEIDCLINDGWTVELIEWKKKK